MLIFDFCCFYCCINQAHCLKSVSQYHDFITVSDLKRLYYFHYYDFDLHVNRCLQLEDFRIIVYIEFENAYSITKIIIIIIILIVFIFSLNIHVSAYPTKTHQRTFVRKNNRVIIFIIKTIIISVVKLIFMV